MMSNWRKIVPVIVLAAFLSACASSSSMNDPAFFEIQPWDEREYVVGTGDDLRVEVWKNKDLSKNVSVRADGMVTLPLLGDVKVAGMTTTQLKALFESKYSEYVANPEVEVSVRKSKSKVIYVGGAVRKPRTIQMTGDITLMQAVMLAGGFTRFAKTKKIVVLRVEGIETRRIKINAKKIMDGTDLSQNIILVPGDVILVPGE